jgi:hypothetical protein
VDLAALRGEVERGLATQGLPGSLADSHPHLFSALPVFISREHAQGLAAVTKALATVVARPPTAKRYSPGRRISRDTTPARAASSWGSIFI